MKVKIIRRKLKDKNWVLRRYAQVLQETNKIQDSRFIFLPQYLEIFFNKIWKHDNKIKNHYLYESKSGYYFKYTVKNDNYYFLAAMSSIFDKSIENIIDLVIKFLEKDTKDIYFTFMSLLAIQ